MKRSNFNTDKVFDFVNTVIMIAVLFIFLYPIYFIVIASISNPTLVLRGEVTILPKEITLVGYQHILEYKDIWSGYLNSIILVFLGVPIALFLILTMAYGLSRKDFKARNIVMVILTITMFFSGGLIPTYLLIKDLNLLDTRWALILPGAVGVYNVIVARTYFSTSIPLEIQEAATMDGCSDLKFFSKIVLPLSKPIIAVISLYELVSKWNIYFAARIYIRDREKLPLQMILNEILVSNKMSADMVQGIEPSQYEIMLQLTNSMKYGVIIVASVPLLLVYPFVQKYFIKGVMIGAVKG